MKAVVNVVVREPRRFFVNYKCVFVLHTFNVTFGQYDFCVCSRVLPGGAAQEFFLAIERAWTNPVVTDPDVVCALLPLINAAGGQSLEVELPLSGIEHLIALQETELSRQGIMRAAG